MRIQMVKRKSMKDHILVGNGIPPRYEISFGKSLRLWLLPICFTVLVILTFLSGCNSSEHQHRSGGSVRIFALGQALVRNTPTGYLEAPLKTIVPILKKGDVVFTNLEVTIEGHYEKGEPTKNERNMQVAQPGVIDFLNYINVNLLSLSNNHSFNFGTSGIRSTLSAVTGRGIGYAGIGCNLREATEPGYLEINGVRVSLVANATVNLPEGVLATDSRPGVNLLRVNHQDDWDRNIAAIREAAEHSDIVLVYQHFQVTEKDIEEGNEYGHSFVSDLKAWQESWAHAAIDAGASMYVGQLSREFKGVEIYKGRPIFYSLGNFIFQSRRPIGRHNKEVYESVMAEISWKKGKIRSISFIPIKIDEGSPGEFFLQRRGFPELAGKEAGVNILSRIVQLSSPYGTQFEIENGRVLIELN